MKQPIVKIGLSVLTGMLVILLLLGFAWDTIVSNHIKQLDKTLLSPATLEAAQEALTEKSAYQAAEYRTRRLQQEAQAQYNVEHLRLEREMLPRYTNLKFYSVAGLISVLGLALIVLACGYAKAKIHASSICTARIGQHSEIPVHYNDLPTFYPIAVNLSLAEIEASASTAHDKAYHISRQMIADISSYMRALAGQRGMFPSETPALGSGDHSVLPSVLMPTFADLLQHGKIARGTPLILGFCQGQPEHRDIKNLKSVAIAGWQGSGKTSSAAYMLGSSVLACNAEAFVIDPHKHHNEGLYALVQPLEQTGQVTVINPFYTPQLIQTLNDRLDRRLRGDESSERPILFVIDELARLAKLECFDELVILLERCTEETRKANIVFLGISTKWTARHFKGRADIRGCMNSALVHKCKPSQAELLLEDSKEKRLVEHLERPGDAILLTDYAATKTVSMPFCTRQDMETVAELIGHSRSPVTLWSPSDSEHLNAAAETSSNVVHLNAIKHPVTPDVQGVTEHVTADEKEQIDAEMTRREDLRRQRETRNLSLRDIAKALGKEGSDIAKFAVKLNRYERNQGTLAPEELAAVTEVIASAYLQKNDEQAEEQETLQTVNA